MSRLSRLILIAVLLMAALPVVPATATPALPPPLDDCPAGTQSSGALYAICMPQIWNGDLVIFAHGYVAPNEPLDSFVSQLLLPDGTNVPDLVTGLGYAFAATSYSKTGLAVQEGIADVRDLVNIFKAQHSGTHHVYLIGASEGGLVTTLEAEQHSTEFSGGLAMCGPIGNFRSQINYFGDFRVIFDYFFPGLIPGSPVNVPQDVIDNWYTTYVPAIETAVLANPHATSQLLSVTGAKTDPNDSSSITETVIGLLSYNVQTTNDGKVELSGQPYDNQSKHYSGSDNDRLLNQSVERFSADQSAVNQINAHYQTSGRLPIPLVTLHNTGDPIVPFWHETQYFTKVLLRGSILKYVGIPSLTYYGHCNFSSTEALAAFAILVLKVGGLAPQHIEAVLPNAAARAKYMTLLQQYGSQH